MPDEKKPTEDEPKIAEAPGLASTDWDAIAESDVAADQAFQNGDIRYDEDEADGELPEEDDDNPYQESDEALPDDAAERAMARDLSGDDTED